jgi:murein DD-endopeptidase MepM/ murein hydrolase activator NlpD
MVAETSSRGSRFFPEIRICLRSSNPVVVAPRLQAALLSTVLAGTAAFAYLGVSRHNVEQLAAKREAVAEHSRAANNDLQNRIGGLARQLTAVMRERNRAQSKAATLADQAGRLRSQLGTNQAKLHDQDQMRRALQQQQAQSAALTAQLGRIEKDRAAEAAQLAQDKASLEETAKELAQLAALRGKVSVKQGRVHLQIDEIWRKLSEIQLPLPGQLWPAAADATAAGAAGTAASNPGDLDPAALAAFEQGLRSAGLDVQRLVGQLSDNHAEGGPFVPPPKADDVVGGQAGRQKLAALQELAKTLPLASPLSRYQIGSRFGPRIDPFNHRAAFHTGLDMDAPYSAPVYATAPGTVIYSGWLGEYGRVVEIDHGSGIVTLYAHLRRCLVAVGQTVSAQAEIGLVGTTGRSTGPHVHYEVRVDGQPQDPEKFLGLERLLPTAMSRPITPAVGGPAESSR